MDTTTQMWARTTMPVLITSTAHLTVNRNNDILTPLVEDSILAPKVQAFVVAIKQLHSENRRKLLYNN